MLQHRLDGMTQERWARLSGVEREKLRDLSDLSPQLVGLEGWRVEVTREDGSKAKFIVGKSTGWRPRHLEVKTRRSFDGGSADRQYRDVRRVEQVR